MNYEILSIETAKKLESAKKIINEIEKELTGEFNFEVYTCKNKKSGGTMKLGASIYRYMFLEQLKELKEKYGWK